MSAHLDGEAEILAAMRTKVAAADGPQAVLEAVVSALLDPYPLYRATIRRVDDAMLEIVALWSSARTSLGVGARMSVLSSSLPTIIKTGKPLLSNEAGYNGRLLEQIVAAEGIASYVTIPIRLDGRIVGLLSFSSRVPDAFTHSDLGFLDEVAAIVEGRVAVALAG